MKPIITSPVKRAQPLASPEIQKFVRESNSLIEAFEGNLTKVLEMAKAQPADREVVVALQRLKATLDQPLTPMPQKSGRGRSFGALLGKTV